MLATTISQKTVSSKNQNDDYEMDYSNNEVSVFSNRHLFVTTIQLLIMLFHRRNLEIQIPINSCQIRNKKLLSTRIMMDLKTLALILPVRSVHFDQLTS